MPTLTIKKAAAGDLTIADAGVIIPGAGSETFTDDNMLRDLSNSKDLRNYIIAGTLVVNDGLQDLSAYDGLVYLDNLWQLIGFDFGPFPGGLFAYHPKRIRRQFLFQQSAGTTTIAAEGYSSAPLTYGTLTSVNDTEGQFIQHASSATANTDAGWAHGSWNSFPRNRKPIVTFRMKTGPSISNVRFWIGLFSSYPVGSSTPAAHIAGFRYDTGVDGTAFWRAVTAANAGVWTVTTTTFPIATDTVYELTVDCSDPNSVKFYINGTLVATNTTQLPTATQNMSYDCQLRTLEAVSKVIKISRIFLEHD